MSDVFSGIDRTSHQGREPIEDDEERLAMKRGDMPPPLPKRVANPRIGHDQTLHKFYSNSDKMHRAALTTLTHKHDLIIVDLSSRNL